MSITVDVYSPTPCNIVDPTEQSEEKEEFTEFESCLLDEIVTLNTQLSTVRGLLKSSREALVYKVGYFESEISILQAKLDHYQKLDSINQALIIHLNGSK